MSFTILLITTGKSIKNFVASTKSVNDYNDKMQPRQEQKLKLYRL